MHPMKTNRFVKSSWPRMAGVGLACTLLCMAASGTAQPAAEDANRAKARQLGAEGIEAYWAKDFVNADQKFEQAYRLYVTPTLALWSARARASLGRLVAAAERYREAARTSVAVGDSAAQKQAQADATKELNELLPRIPSLTIVVHTTDLTGLKVTLNDLEIPAAQFGKPHSIDPGRYRVLAVKAEQRFETVVELAEKDRKVATFQFKPQLAVAPVAAAGAATNPSALAEAPPPSAPPAPDQATKSSPFLTAAIVGFSVGAVGLVTSGVTALVAGGKCSDKVCENQSDKESYDSLKTVSTVSFWLGAAFAAGGLASFLLVPSADAQPEASLSLTIAPNGLAVHGAF
jgi:hypothetical protein